MLAALAGAGCGGGDLTLPSEGVAAKIVVVKGDAQSAKVSTALPEGLVVRVTDSRNQPVGNQQVTFAVDAGGGTVSPAVSATTSDGLARTRWILGPTVGAQHLTAKATGNGAPTSLSAGFTATGTASAAAKIEAVAGNNQTNTVGTSVPIDPTVKVTDSQGNPVVGASVTFAVTGGGGLVNPTNPVPTNSNGLASVGWTLGAQAGQNTLTATVAGTNVAGNPVAFTATGAPGSAGKLVIVTQPPATGESGIPLSPPPSVQLQDVNGNDVKQSGVAITAEIASGPSGATLSGATAATNNKGLATFSGLVLTGPAGQYTINFRGDNLSGVTSTPITLSAGGATKLAVLVPPSATAQSRVPFSQQPQIELQDPAGNRVARPGVNVLVTLSGQPAGGGSLGGGPTTIQTGADGIARFSGLLITGATGQYTLLFASGNLSSATAMVNLQNPAPTANADPYSTDEDASLTVAASGVLGNDSDPNGDPLTAVKLSNPAHGSVTLNSNGSFAYTPEPDFNGSDSFTYAANDGTQSSSPATVTITVNPVNDAPSFTMPDLTDEATSGLVPQTETRPGWVTGISAGPPNEGSQTVSFEVSTNSPGLFLDPPSITPDGTLSYRPGVLASGEVTVTVIAHDSEGGLSGSQNFTITLTAF